MFQTNKATRLNRTPIGATVPALLVGALVALPIIYLVVTNFFSGFTFFEILFRTETLAILFRTITLAGFVTFVCVLIALPLAWLTTRSDLPLRQIWTNLTLLPLVLPSYVGAFLVMDVLGPRGRLQSFLAPFGVEQLPPIYGFSGASLTLILLSYPYVLLTVRSALLRLDNSLEDAAYSLGNGRWYTFWRITLPQLRPSIAAGGLLVALYTLSDFGAVSLLRYETFTWAIYLEYEVFNTRLAAAHSTVLILVAFFVLWFESVLRRRSDYFGPNRGASKAQRLAQLRSWRWPCLIFCFSVVLCALVVPVGILIYWVVRGLLFDSYVGSFWIATINSGYVSIIAAVVTVICSLPIGLLTTRYPSKLATMIERFSFTGFALPGITVALSLVFIGVNFLSLFYQTLGMLIFAYLVLFIPVAIGPVKSSLLRINPRIEESAAVLGKTPTRILWLITFPLVRPGLLSGGALVFLVTMKELPATLILSPIGLSTLATRTWSAASEAFFAQAAAPALLLVLVSLIVTVFIILPSQRERWANS